MVQRVITADMLEASWDTVRDSVPSPDDAVIIEENGEPRFAIVTFDRYQQMLERERQDRLAEARRSWEALVASIGDRNSDLSPEEVWELATRADREERESVRAEEGSSTRDGDT